MDLYNIYNNMVELDAKKDDVIVNTESFKFNTYVDEGPSLKFNRNGYTDCLKLNKKSMSQLNNLIGLPNSYFNKIEPHMQDCNVKYMLRKMKHQDVMLRNYRNENIRGIVGPKYTIFNDSQLVKAVIDVLETGIMKQPELVRDYTDDGFMRLQVIDKGEWVKDGTCLSIHVCNGELGDKSVSIDGGLYTIKCTNGLLTGLFTDNYKRKHIGINGNQLNKDVYNCIYNVMNSVDNVKFALEKSDNKKITIDNIQKFLKGLTSLPKAWRDHMLETQEMRATGEISAWDFVSDMTFTAQGFFDGKVQYEVSEEVREQIERVAGEFLYASVR